MDYNQYDVEEAVSYYGEVFFVLDSDREYEIHGERDYEFIEADDGDTLLKTEGMKDGEYIDVTFPISSIEHHYSHREA